MNISLPNRFSDNRHSFGEKKGCFLYRDHIGLIGDAHASSRAGTGCDCRFLHGQQSHMGSETSHGNLSQI